MYKPMRYGIKKQFEMKDFITLGFEKNNKIMIIGPLDSGKTYLCHKMISFFLIRKISQVCFFDLDVGQSSVGPPCTIGTTYLHSAKDLKNLCDNPIAHLGFIGSLYPYGFENKIYKSINNILDIMPSDSTIVIDTTGFKNIENKVIKFKCEKIKIISPDIVILLSDFSSKYTQITHFLREATEKVKGKLLIFPHQNTFALKPKLRRRTHHLKAFNCWLKDAMILNLPAKLLDFSKEVNVMQKNHGILVGFLDEKEMCIGGGILICKNNNNLTIYGNLKAGGKIASIDIGTLKFKIKSWEIIYGT